MVLKTPGFISMLVLSLLANYVAPYKQWQQASARSALSDGES
jgi:hypothetical protein